jgi:signal transduction histidine kinase
MRSALSRSLSIPLGLAAIAVALSIALLVGWTLLWVRELLRADDITQSIWLLSAGSASFLLIMSVLVLFSVSLVREAAEVRKQNSFIDSITHELKSPLASLRLGAETLGRAGISPEQAQMLRQMMIDDIDRLSLFIDGILDASRLQQGRHEAQPPTDLDLAAFLRQCATAATDRHRISPRWISVFIDEPISITTDKTALETIFKNLIDNAIKYASDTPRVEVHATNHGGDMVRLEVKDHGIGISKQDQARVFERFYRAPDEAVRARCGTGLGLHVVWMLVKNLGGNVTVSSEGVGRGTTFTVLLPRAPR